MQLFGPKKGVAYNAYVVLTTTGSNNLKSTPTIDAGDFQLSKDGAAFGNPTTLPAVTPAANVGVKIALSATEMNADVIVVRWIDQTPVKEWIDGYVTIYTQTYTLADLYTLIGLVPAALLATVYEGTRTVQGFFKLAAAMLWGKRGGGGTGTNTYKADDNATTRITQQVDSSGTSTSNPTLNDA